MINGTNVMIDLETMGVSYNPAIAAIGAVAFNADGITSRFYQVVDLQSCIYLGLTVDGSTISWWLEQSDSARLALLKERVLLPQALRNFNKWGNELGGIESVWANGATDDLVWLDSAYKVCGYLPLMPDFYKKKRCYRTIKAIFPEVEIPKVGTEHNAQDDAEYQALKLIEINRRTGWRGK